MSRAYLFIKQYELRTGYLATLLLCVFVLGVARLTRGYDNPIIATVIVCVCVSLGIEWLFGWVALQSSNLMAHRRKLEDDEEMWLGRALSQAELPPQWAIYKPRLVLLELGEVPFFAASNISEPRLYISTHTLRNTDPDDWPMLMLMAGGYLQVSRRRIKLNPMLPAWGLCAYATASNLWQGVPVLVMMLFIIPLMGQYLRGAYLRGLYNWLATPEKQHGFVMALLRYYQGFEPRLESTKMRRYLLLNMRFPKDQAMALLAQMVA